MAAGNTQGAKASEEDLSMEEILQSIRRIIAEDDSTKKTAPSDAAAADTDVLELTDLVKEEPPAETPPAEEKPAEVASEPATDVLSTIDQALAPETKTDMAATKTEEKPAASAAQDDIDAMFAAAPAAPAAPEPPVPAPVAAPVATPPAPAAPVAAAKPEPAQSVESLLSNEATMAAASAIQKLKSAEPELPPVVTTPSAHFRSGNTVEDMVVDMLRPMMKTWLDDNLPQIVDRIVQREVKKLTKYLTDKGE